MMRLFSCNSLLLLILFHTQSFSQFHDYSIKYGIQSHLLKPSSEFDTDSYKMSLLGRGFIRLELNTFLESEIGIGIGQLNGKDFNNNNWSTNLFPTDLRFLISPFNFEFSSPYFYTALALLNWRVSTFPSNISPEKTTDTGWNLAIPLGAGVEIGLTEEILLDINGGYTYSLTDDLNYYNNLDTKDGYYNFGIGLTFVMGGSLTDQDNDGLTQKFENEIGTDPDLRDTDKDNLFDGDELNIYKTDPLKFDSDNDGISDFEEVKRYNTDPNSRDTDGDDLLDYDEIVNYKSNPSSKDTDLDNLNDGYEINIYKTNPLLKDSDVDKLYDDQEIKTFNTDPNNADTDGDGITDGEEILIDKTDPLDKMSFKEKEENINKVLYIQNDKTIILKGITFETNRADITRDSQSALNKTFLTLKEDPTLHIEIRGYTDNVGNAEYNKTLSQLRADAVKVWLVKKGIDALRIKATGYGELNPIASNATHEGRNQNRRIEIIKLNK